MSVQGLRNDELQTAIDLRRMVIDAGLRAVGVGSTPELQVALRSEGQAAAHSLVTRVLDLIEVSGTQGAKVKLERVRDLLA